MMLIPGERNVEAMQACFGLNDVVPQTGGDRSRRRVALSLSLFGNKEVNYSVTQK